MLSFGEFKHTFLPFAIGRLADTAFFAPCLYRLAAVPALRDPIGPQHQFFCSFRCCNPVFIVKYLRLADNICESHILSTSIRKYCPTLFMIFQAADRFDGDLKAILFPDKCKNVSMHAELDCAVNVNEFLYFDQLLE